MISVLILASLLLILFPGRCLRPGYPLIRLQALATGRYPLLSLTQLFHRDEFETHRYTV